MLRGILTAAAAAAAILVWLGCDANNGPIYPMSVGSVWHTESYVLEGTTTAALDTVQTAVTTTTATAKVNLDNGKEAVRFATERTTHFSTDSTVTDTLSTFVREEDGAIIVHSSLSDSVGDTLMMAEPEIGQSWSPGFGTSLVVGQEDVTVPARTYRKAWKVKTIMSFGIFSIEVYSWYARGTGNVKNHYEFTYEGQNQVYDEELTSATIK
jgi:hypothetical protein